MSTTPTMMSILTMLAVLAIATCVHADHAHHPAHAAHAHQAVQSGESSLRRLLTSADFNRPRCCRCCCHRCLPQIHGWTGRGADLLPAPPAATDGAHGTGLVIDRPHLHLHGGAGARGQGGARAGRQAGERSRPAAHPGVWAVKV
eukprot:366042-Chlamydomonas_euryale.AAC.3